MSFPTPVSMLLAHVLRTSTRRSTCRSYSYGLLPNVKSDSLQSPVIKPSDESGQVSSSSLPPPPPPPAPPLTDDGEVDIEALRKQRRTEWKRRQGVSLIHTSTKPLARHSQRDMF